MVRPTPHAALSASLPLVVLALLTAGCGEKKTESGLTPEAQKRFGYAGMPMPPEARAAMQKSSQKAGAPAPPVPGAPPGPAGAAPR